jgi:Uma2 family endonuclease
MTVAARRIDLDVWTKDQFLAWVEAQPRDSRYEFDGSHPVAMSPATTDNNDIARNIREYLRAKLPATMRCKVYGPQQQIETVGGALREPDAFVACSKRIGKAVAIAAPVAVFEVVSLGKENRSRDEDTKVDEYESVPTILRYGIVESERRSVTVF